MTQLTSCDSLGTMAISLSLKPFDELMETLQGEDYDIDQCYENEKTGAWHCRLYSHLFHVVPSSSDQESRVTAATISCLVMRVFQKEHQSVAYLKSLSQRIGEIPDNVSVTWNTKHQLILRQQVNLEALDEATSFLNHLEKAFQTRRIVRRRVLDAHTGVPIIKMIQNRERSIQRRAMENMTYEERSYAFFEKIDPFFSIKSLGGVFRQVTTALATSASALSEDSTEGDTLLGLMRDFLRSSLA